MKILEEEVLKISSDMGFRNRQSSLCNSAKLDDVNVLETDCLFLKLATETDRLFLKLLKRLTAWFSGPLQRLVACFSAPITVIFL